MSLTVFKQPVYLKPGVFVHKNKELRQGLGQGTWTRQNLHYTVLAGPRKQKRMFAAGELAEDVLDVLVIL